MNKRALLPLLLIVGILIIIFHQDIVETLEDFFSRKDIRPVIATLETFDGDVHYKKTKTLRYKRVKSNLNLRDQDTVVTGSESTAVIVFPSGFKLEVAQNSVVVIEQPQVSADGVMQITFLHGDFRVLNAGQAGRLILSKENTFLDAAGRAPPKVPLLVSLKPPQSVVAPPLKSETITEISKVVEAPKLATKKKHETLSDDYIASLIKRQTSFFNRCYAEHLRLNPNARGRVSLSFTISASGNVSNVRLLGSTLHAPRLEQCAMAVIERVRFTPFDGDPIIINYPINFE